MEKSEALSFNILQNLRDKMCADLYEHERKHLLKEYHRLRTQLAEAQAQLAAEKVMADILAHSSIQLRDNQFGSPNERHAPDPHSYLGELDKAIEDYLSTRQPTQDKGE